MIARANEYTIQSCIGRTHLIIKENLLRAWTKYIVQYSFTLAEHSKLVACIVESLRCNNTTLALRWALVECKTRISAEILM